MTNMDEKHLVAIDLGTSKFTLTVARVNGYDIQIVYYKEVPAAGIRNSYVLNPSHVARQNVSLTSRSHRQWWACRAIV